MLTASLFGDHAMLFLTGTTVLLGVGCALMAAMRSPAHRQRTGELTIAVTIGWLALACLPLPRWLPENGGWQVFSLVRSTVKQQLVGNHPSENLSSDSCSTPTRMSTGKASTIASSDAIAQPDADLNAIVDFRAEEPMDRAPLSEDPILNQDVFWEEMSVPTARAAVWVGTVYLVGAAVCIGWFCCGLVRLMRIRQAGRRPPAWLSELFESLSEPRGRKPLLLVSRRCPRPMFWGLWRPIIVLPSALARRRCREQVRMVLLHELGHVARHDGWSNLLVCLAYPLFYAHPLF